MGIAILVIKFLMMDRIVAKLEMKYRGVATNNLLSLRYDEADTLIRKLNDLITNRIIKTNHEILSYRVMIIFPLIVMAFVLFNYAMSENVLLIVIGCLTTIAISIPG
jgi:hypothetical protein